MAVEKLPELPDIIFKRITTQPVGVTVIQQRFQRHRNTIILIKKGQNITDIFLHAGMIIASLFFIFCPPFLIVPDESFIICVIQRFGTEAFVIAGEDVKCVGTQVLIFFNRAYNIDTGIIAHLDSKYQNVLS